MFFYKVSFKLLPEANQSDCRVNIKELFNLVALEDQMKNSFVICEAVSIFTKFLFFDNNFIGIYPFSLKKKIIRIRKNFNNKNFSKFL